MSSCCPQAFFTGRDGHRWCQEQAKAEAQKAGRQPSTARTSRQGNASRTTSLCRGTHNQDPSEPGRQGVGMAMAFPWQHDWKEKAGLLDGTLG